MRVIRRDFYDLSQKSVVTIIPIFDPHVGAAACDEERLVKDIARIKDDPYCYWIGGGDYGDFINRKDKRYDTMSVAEWCRNKPDIVGEQLERLKLRFGPIAPKCLGLLRGNHEASILAHYERDIYSELVTFLKEKAGMPDDGVLGIGTYGWLLVGLYRSKKKERGNTVRFNLHHGFTGGRLQGGKALSMQRWLWAHDCDLALQGHSHNSLMQVEQVEGVSDMGEAWEKRRIGIYCGTYLKACGKNDGTYSENKGYLPNGQAHWEIRLRAYEEEPTKRIEVVAI